MHGTNAEECRMSSFGSGPPQVDTSDGGGFRPDGSDIACGLVVAVVVIVVIFFIVRLSG